MIKRIIVTLIALALLGTVAFANSTAVVSPITDATYASISVDNGWGSQTWFTDKGPVVVDVKPFIVEGRLFVPFRWAVELFGGTAEWTSAEDGTTNLVTLYAPPLKVITETVTVTVTNTVLVNTPTVYVPTPTVYVSTPTVYVPAWLPTYKLEKNVETLSFVPANTRVDFWGIAPIQNAEVIVNVSPTYVFPGDPVMAPVSVWSDWNGFYEGHFHIAAGARVGTWDTKAVQGDWISAIEQFVVLAP